MDILATLIVGYALVSFLPGLLNRVFMQPAVNPNSQKQQQQQQPTKEEQAALLEKQRYYTLAELKQFNGVNDKPIYIAIKGKIFDVSSREDFYGPEGGYHLFAGHDATRALAKMSFEPEELAQDHFDDLTFMEREALNDWLMKFEVMKGYPVVGRVLKPCDMTRDALAKFNGKDGMAIYVALNGVIYDVTLKGSDNYGAQGSYSQFAGRDVSRALAKMSFEPEDLASSAIDDLDDKQRQTLAEWVAKFEKKYAVVGALL